MNEWTIDVLLAARRVANLAEAEGVLSASELHRPKLEHMGAVVADAVLQAGLNYASVVRPRVMTILRTRPKTDRVSALVELVERREVAAFLNWQHSTKVERFERLVDFLVRRSVETASDLRLQLGSQEFRLALKAVSDVGPKTVDYLACLVGVDSIAVDRHVRSYAHRADVDTDDYDFLHEVFCSAADWLGISRRAFDAWIWRQATSMRKVAQLPLALDCVGLAV